MKNKSILLLIIFFSAGIISAKAQTAQQTALLQKWKADLEQKRKHREEVLAKTHEQDIQLQYEKKPEQIISPVQQQPQIKTNAQQNSQQNVLVKKEETEPIDSKKIKPANKNIKKEE